MWRLNISLSWLCKCLSLISYCFFWRLKYLLIDYVLCLICYCFCMRRLKYLLIYYIWWRYYMLSYRLLESLNWCISWLSISLGLICDSFLRRLKYLLIHICLNSLKWITIQTRRNYVLSWLSVSLICNYSFGCDDWLLRWNKLLLG